MGTRVSPEVRVPQFGNCWIRRSLGHWTKNELESIAKLPASFPSSWEGHCHSRILSLPSVCANGRRPCDLHRAHACASSAYPLACKHRICYMSTIKTGRNNLCDSNYIQDCSVFIYFMVVRNDNSVWLIKSQPPHIGVTQISIRHTKCNLIKRNAHQVSSLSA